MLILMYVSVQGARINAEYTLKFGLHLSYDLEIGGICPTNNPKWQPRSEFISVSAWISTEVLLWRAIIRRLCDIA